MKRFTSIDFLRGLVMVIMALDHVRDLFHSTALTQDPSDLATTTPTLFFTRWITHLCAPTFVFLSGTSAYLSFHRQNDISKSKSFLIKRGFWLIFLEFTVITFGLWFDIHFRTMLFQVIAAIGFGFIFLAFMLKLNTKTIRIIGILIISLHGLLSLIPLPENKILQFVASVFFARNAFPITQDFLFIIGYPIIPWFGIMLVGFSFGEFFSISTEKRKSLFLKIGLGSIAVFVILRFINLYGNPTPWTPQKDSLFTFLSFINVSKYPPSLMFSLLMLGIAIILLSIFEGIDNQFSRIIETYGNVPLFYYLIHWYFFHSLMFVFIFAKGFGIKDLEFGFNLGRPNAWTGLSLPMTYLVWISGVAALYPLCKWYSQYKSQNRDKEWLRYL